MGKEDKITPSQRLLELIRKSSGAAGAAPVAPNAGQPVRRPTVGPPTTAAAQPDPVAAAGPAAAPVVEEAVAAPTASATNSRLEAPAEVNPRLVYDPYGAGPASPPP